MRRLLAALAVLIIGIILIPAAALSNKEPARAEPVQADLVSCAQEGNSVVCRLLDNTVILAVPIPTVKVPGPTIRLPGPTIRIPGPTVIIPGATVTVPGLPGATVTVSANPGPTRTVTIRPSNPGPSALPTRTVTISVGPQGTTTITPSGQNPTVRATITPPPEVETRTVTRTKTETVIRNVVLGTLVSLVIAALGILALYLGYIMGQKDAQKNEDQFLESLIGRVRGERKG